MYRKKVFHTSFYLSCILKVILSCTIGQDFITYTVYPEGGKIIDTTNKPPIITSPNGCVEITVQDQCIPVLGNRLLKIGHEINRLSFFTCGMQDIEEECFRYQKIKDTIQITGNNISAVKRRTFAELYVRRITLVENSIEIVENEAFFNLSNLEELDLSWNMLTRMNPNAVFGTPKLTKLQLAHNLIEILEKGAFKFMQKNHALLMLPRNRIRQVDVDVMQGMKSRNFSLGLSSNLIETLPDGVFNNQEIMSLTLKDNNIHYMPKNVCGENSIIRNVFLDDTTLGNSSEFLNWLIEREVTILLACKNKTFCLDLQDIIDGSKASTCNHAKMYLMSAVLTMFNFVSQLY